jgi:hypothetical protein
MSVSSWPWNPRFHADTLKEYAAAAEKGHIAIDPFFSDMAGNAWSGPIVLSIFISILCHITDKHIANYSVDEIDNFSDDTSINDVFMDLLAM